MSKWNPLNPESPLRSKRVQGAFVILAALASEALGKVVSEDALIVFSDQTNELLTQVGALWGLVGAITAKTSTRLF